MDLVSQPIKAYQWNSLFKKTGFKMCSIPYSSFEKADEIKEPF